MRVYALILIIFVFASQALGQEVFKAYQDPASKPKSLKTRDLVNYAEEDRLIAQKFEKKLSNKERAILHGLYWLIGFADSDKNFDFLSSSFLLLLYEMTFSKGRVEQQEIAKLILKKSLARAEKRLSKLFPPSERSQWMLIGLFHILLKYPEFMPSFQKYYEDKFAIKDPESQSKEEKRDFDLAIKDKSYRAIYEELIDTSFLHYYLSLTKDPIKKLPRDNFPVYLKQLESLDYDENLPVKSDIFINIGYLATHVILVLTNYGEFLIKNDVNMRKAKTYIKNTFDKVRNELGYLDLLAEYVQCLEILEPRNNEHIKESIKFLIDLQRSDGSWGTASSIQSDPYTAFHPTWAVLTALNQR